MEQKQLIDIISNVFGTNIQYFVKQVAFGKWYDQKFDKCDNIEAGESYGVMIDGINYFTFKAAKNDDNIVKSFITNYINKYEVGRFVRIDGEILKQTKTDVIKALQNKCIYGVFYSTNYGIGYYCFMQMKDTFNKNVCEMNNYLNCTNIAYANEYSEAGYVYRYLLTSGNKTNNTAVLANFIK